MKQIIILMVLILKLLAEKKYDLNLTNDYHVVLEWFEVASYNKKYVKDLAAVVFKRTRNVTALNVTVTFNVDLGNNLDLIIQAYKFASNEYREFPMRIQVNLCQAVEQDAGGLEKLVKCGNFTGCDLVKGRKYDICNWAPDENKFPPYFPSGRYMLELQGIYNSK